MLRDHIYAQLLKIENASGDKGLANNLDKRIREGKSFLFRNDSGFIIATLIQEDDALVFFVNAAYCSNGKGYRDYHQIVEQIARGSDCQFIKFSSFHQHYSRLNRRYGYVVEKTDKNKRIYFSKKLNYNLEAQS